MLPPPHDTESIWSKTLANITEDSLESEMLDNLEACAAEAASWLNVDMALPAEDLVRSVDEAVYKWQKADRPDAAEQEDMSFMLGSLWGQQLVRKLGWEWAMVTFEDHEDSRAVGVFSPDRALAIYPFHFIFGCMENNAPVTIMLSFNLLVDGSRIPPLPAVGYENVMDNVRHIVPRDEP